MDILNSLCNSNGTFQRTRIPVPEVTKCKVENMSDEEMESDDEEDFQKDTTIYAEEYKRLENKRHEEMLQRNVVKFFF